MLVTLRVPSFRRATCTIRSSARRDLLADGADRQVDAGHQDHRLEAGERVARGVGVDRGHRAVVAGVHRLEHVERLAAADLADDDAVGPHTQEFRTRSRDRDLALAFDVGRARLEADDVRLLQLQFGGVLDRDDALVRRDEADRMLSSVVLPEPVPPEISMLSRASTHALRGTRTIVRGRRAELDAGPRR